MTEDQLLLQDYATSGSQSAFATLAQRYVNLVYSAAKRQMRGDAHLAEDVTQAVFLVLAQRAKTIPGDRPLSAWLLKVTGYCAANARRARDRREAYERRAASVRETNASGDAEWGELSPLLDQGLNKLGARDRSALVLRFMEQKSLRQVGEALGISEVAAQKRVMRAVEKLREYFRRRGVATMSVAGLSAVLAAKSVEAAPVKLAARVASGAGASTVGASTATAVAKGAIMAMTTQKTVATGALVAALLLGVGGGVVAIKAIVASPSPRQVRAAPATTVATQPAPPGGLTFADGTVVRLIGVGEVPAQSNGIISDAMNFIGMGTPQRPQRPTSWWSAEGSPIAAPPNDGSVLSTGSPALGHRVLNLMFAWRGPALVGPSIQIIGSDNEMASSSRYINGENVMRMVRSFPGNLDGAQVRIGVGQGPWREDAATIVSPDAAATTQASLFQNIRDEKGQCVADFNCDNVPKGDRTSRIIAVLRNGKTITPREWSGYNNRATVRFDCRAQDVAKLAWMSQAYQWQTLGTIALRPTKVNANSTVLFNDGTTLQVLGLNDPSDPKTWWKMDGTPTGEPAFLSRGSIAMDYPLGRRIDLIMRINGSALDSKGLTVHASPATGQTATLANGSATDLTVKVIVDVPKDQPTTDLRFGLAKGPWTGELNLDCSDGKMPPVGSTGAGFTFQDISEENRETKLYLRRSSDDTEENRQVVVVADGKELHYAGMTTSLLGSTYTFRTPKKNVTRIIVRSRPYEWITLKDVALHPTTAPAVGMASK